MGSVGGNARVTQTSEDLETIIRWWGAKEKLMWCIVPSNTAMSNINEKSCRGECIGPKARWSVSTKQESADTVINGAEHTFDTAVLRRGVRTREPDDCAMGCKKSADGKVVELLSVVSLQSMNGPPKLYRHIGKKCGECRRNIRFLAKRKGPHKMGKIIQDHKIIKKTGITWNR